MNWGFKITVLYLGFVGIIVTLAVISFNNKTELVASDYYSQELNFQNKINATSNAINLDLPITHLVNGKTIEISLPKNVLTKDLSGTIYFFRPSDSSLDKSFELKPDSIGKQLISDIDLSSGIYKMQISFKSNNVDYYKEDVLNLK